MLTHGKIEKVYQCDVCEFTCSTSLNLKRHGKTHLPKLEEKSNQYECHHCSVTFLTMVKLEQHLHNKHFVIQQHECLECGIFFKTTQYLQGHMLVHSSRPFHQCQHCLVAFTENVQLQKHLVIRLKEGVCNTLWPGLYYGQ
jgi:hypothetical protein